MKKQNIQQDERVLAQKQKISSEAFTLLWLALLASTLIQQFIFNAPFVQYAAEWICFVGASIYLIVRNLIFGNNLFSTRENAKKIAVINSIVAGITVTAINGVLNYTQYAERYKEDGIGYFIAVLAVTFISVAVCCFVVISFLNYLNKKKQAKIHKQLDEDE